MLGDQLEVGFSICALNLKYFSCRARGNSTARGGCRCDELATGLGDCLKCVYMQRKILCH